MFHPVVSSWIRGFYRDVYQSTGGVPTAFDPALPASLASNTDGAYVNYPDIDLNDTDLNTSGQPWHQLYYKNNYARLQKAKQHWDPHNIFRHGQSVELPKTS